MASEGEKDKTDTTSIKPVSSLRNRFENLGTTDVVKRLPSPVGTPTRPSQHFPSSTQPGHSLFDTGRLNFKSGTQGTAPNHEGGEQKEPDLLRREARSRFRDGLPPVRPASMGPMSFSSTPALTIQSPQSPPKSAFLVEHARTGTDLPRPRSTEPVPRPLVPPLNRQTRPAISKGPATPGAGPRSPRPPPPVNRASKPVLPSNLTATLLTREHNVDDDSVSPFGTPPDSPEKPGSPTKPSLPPPPLHHQVQARRHSRNLAEERSAVQREQEISNDFSDSPENRPDLPRRASHPYHAVVLNAPQSRKSMDQARHSINYSASVRSTPRRQPPETGGLRHSQSVRAPPRSLPPPRPAEEAKDGRRPSQTQAFLPPPKRLGAVNGTKPATLEAQTTGMLPPSEIIPKRDVSPRHQIRCLDSTTPERSAPVRERQTHPSSDYPDASRVNRRPPRSKHGTDHIWTHYDTRLFDICGKYVCSSGYITRAWDITTGRMVVDQAHEEREVKVLSMVFKPGASAEEEGVRVWCGNNLGDIQEVDIQHNTIANYRQGAHGRCEVSKMHRYQNTIWSLDGHGKLLVWLPNERGVPDLDVSPNSHRVAKGHSFSVIARDKLWLAAGKEIRVYDPVYGHESSFHVTNQPLSQPGIGDITSGTVLPSQLDLVYFGHSDGKVSVYSTTDYTCQAVVNVSTYKITSLAGVGNYIWAGFGTGWMYVYDIQEIPWRVLKEWRAHDNPVASIVVDRSSVWRFGHLQVASIGLDNAIKLWDGMLEDDWLENEMHGHDNHYCEFREIKTVVVTWNAGAATPADIQHDQKDITFFREVIQPHDPPDIIVFGFQELVDLEDKGLTAKNLFKGRHKHKGNQQDPEHIGHQYRAWRDFLAQLIEETMPANESYALLQTGSLVGLFSCIFIKASQRNRVQHLQIGEVKRGMGGLYGNKGAIMIRFVLDSTSLCFTNCHLAAGQKETLARNTDAAAILEACALELIQDADRRMDSFVGGGDGSMIMDHEICVLNGDLNYRLDTMGRDSVIKAIRGGNLERLLERDQLLLSRKRNPTFKLRWFREERISFIPTYKYDVGTDQYDSSEKHRSPAWCDRILYRGEGRIKMLDYRRHECWASDHRPVSGTFKMRIKHVIPEKREKVWEQVQESATGMKMRVAEQIRLDYLVNVLGLNPQEAKMKLKA